MKKALIMTALLATAATADIPSVAVSADITLDTQTQGAGVLAQDAAVDARGLTFDVSGDILLNTKVPYGTLIILR